MSTTDPRPPQAERSYTLLAARRSSLVRRLTVVTLVAFFTQQVLTNFTDILDGFVVDGLSWAYLYAFGLFALVVVLTAVYSRSMDRVEREVAAGEEVAR
jgi:putative solute:sodium symporter small subunit